MHGGLPSPELLRETFMNFEISEDQAELSASVRSVLESECPPAIAREIVESAYMEGDVLLSLGATQVRASRLYYDFFQDRALILDAVVHSTLVDRNIPLYLRASEIRQLSPREYAASDAILTTSEFYTPHYHVGARRIELVSAQ